MIDYEKIKLAEELALKIDCYLSMIIRFSNRHPEKSLVASVYLSYGDDDTSGISTLDEAIEKLQELNAPKPKYKVGQEVWVVWSDQWEIRKLLIRDMQYFEELKYWKIEGELQKDSSPSCKVFPEHMLYQSREELIQAQINYWEGLKDD